MSIIVKAQNVARVFGGERKLFGGPAPAVHAVRELSLDIATGETLGIVGESGCGKSTLARMLSGMDAPTLGSITIDGISITDSAASHRKQLARKVQYVFQDPVSSLNPRKTIRQSLEAPMIHLLGLDGSERSAKLKELMDAVNLRPEFLDRYPHEFSGGQAQRIGIARALAVRPKVLVLDEPVSALDVSVQAQVLNVLQDIKKEYGLTYIFISHDLSVIESISDRVMVMYFGSVVETAPVDQLFEGPRHPYTRLLLNSVPLPGKRTTVSAADTAELPDPLNPPIGCAFASRCDQVTAECLKVQPSLKSVAPNGHEASCLNI